LLRSGNLTTDWASVAARFCEAVSELGRRGFAGGLITCDVRAVHDAGGSEAQELAVGLALGVAYLRAMADNGHDVSRISSDMSWTMAIDADQFLGIAKLRAMRLLWGRIVEASGLEANPIDIHAETAWRMMSRRDAAVNLLRTTMATFTAGIGGADSITVLPYTLPFGLPNAFARRIARNTQTVLLEESNLWRVADPVAGAGAYEAITDELSNAAWAAFQEIEAEGGLLKSLNDGRLQTRITAVRLKRQEKIARRDFELTGTSAFPNLAEVDEETLDVPRRSTDAAGAAPAGSGNAKFADLVRTEREAPASTESSSPPAPSLTVEALPSLRDSEPFEALRDAADAAAAKHGRAHVFLANLGPLAEHGTRATWIRNLLAAGGIDAQSNDGFTNSADAGNAFAENGAAIACMCGTDETYSQLAESTAGALKAAGARKVYLAGRAGGDEAALREAGVDGFLHHGMNVVEALEKLQEDLGVGG
ncbi:MAG: methylmalonyl-CoA mutase family protein, partial [Hyphomicrobiaceae bacterium]